MCSGAFGALDVVADPRSERAARTLPTGAPTRQRPRGVAFGLLLVADHQHPFVAPGFDQGHSRDGGRGAHRARGVHAVDRLADGTDGVAQRQLGHHHAFERVGGLAEHDGVDVLERQLRVLERPQDRFANQTFERDVGTATLVLRLTDADHCTRNSHQLLPSNTQTRFC